MKNLNLLQRSGATTGCNVTLLLETGRITISGDAKELAASEEIRKAYLGG